MADGHVFATKHTTGIGVAHHPHLITPDTFKNQTKFKTGLILEGAEADKLIALIDAEMEKAVILKDAAIPEMLKALKAKTPKGKPVPELPEQEQVLPYRNELDEAGELTGRTIFNFSTTEFKTNWKTKEKTKRIIAFFDAKANPIATARRPNLSGGSKMRVSFTMYPYHAEGLGKYGVSLRIEGIKVIKVVLFSAGGSAEDMGFGGADEGWEDDTSSDPMSADDSAASGDEADGDFTGTAAAGPSASDF